MSDKMVMAQGEALQPTTMRELWELSKTAAGSGFFGAKSPEQAMMVMMAGRDLGLSYTQSLRAFHVIEGRPALSADGMVAVCLGHSEVCEYFVTVESTAECATVTTKRKGQEPRTLTFTYAEAQAAGLTEKRGQGGKNNWEKYPGRMCLARAKSFLARDVYPDLLMGMYDPDELESSEPPRMPKPNITVVESKRPAPATVRDADPIPDAEEEDDDESLLETMAARISAAATREELDGLAKELGVLQAQKRITEGERQALRGLWGERRDALKEVTT